MPTTRIDANRIRYTYPILRRVPRYGEIAAGGASTVEVAKINFNNQEQNSYTFTGIYSSIPVCVISPEDENVNVFITSLTTTAIQVSASSPFTGSVHVHIYPDEET